MNASTWERKDVRTKGNNYSLVDGLLKPMSLEPVIEKVWQTLE
jgi:hypothetical protein